MIWRMAAPFEYKYVTLSLSIKAMRTSDREALATEELNNWAREGWEPVNVTRPDSIGPIGCLLRRPPVS